MKRKSMLCVCAVAIAAIAIFASKEDCGIYNHSMFESDVEALTICESLGWKKNDGNCVYNSSSKQYFCKDDTWHEITDCKK